MIKRLILIIIIIFLIFILSLSFYNKSSEDFDISDYYNIEYIYEGEEMSKSCLTFLKDGVFSEYDCDSEPTDIKFSGEFCHHYSYDKNSKNLTFYCEYDTNADKFNVKVLNWTRNVFQIEFIDNDNVLDITYVARND